MNLSKCLMTTCMLLVLSTSLQDVLNSSNECASSRHLDMHGTSCVTINSDSLSTGVPAQKIYVKVTHLKRQLGDFK